MKGIIFATLFLQSCFLVTATVESVEEYEVALLTPNTNASDASFVKVDSKTLKTLQRLLHNAANTPKNIKKKDPSKVDITSKLFTRSKTKEMNEETKATDNSGKLFLRTDKNDVKDEMKIRNRRQDAEKMDSEMKQQKVRFDRMAAETNEDAQSKRNIRNGFMDIKEKRNDKKDSTAMDDNMESSAQYPQNIPFGDDGIFAIPYGNDVLVARQLMQRDGFNRDRDGFERDGPNRDKKEKRMEAKSYNGDAKKFLNGKAKKSTNQLPIYNVNSNPQILTQVPASRPLPPAFSAPTQINPPLTIQSPVLITPAVVPNYTIPGPSTRPQVIPKSPKFKTDKFSGVKFDKIGGLAQSSNLEKIRTTVSDFLGR